MSGRVIAVRQTILPTMVAYVWKTRYPRSLFWDWFVWHGDLRVIPSSYIVSEIADNGLAVVLLVQCDCSRALEDTDTEEFVSEIVKRG
jgi:hypothetical protein